MAFILCITALISADSPSSFEDRVEAVEHNYDIEETQKLIDALRSEGDREMLLVRALLNLSELYRIEFELLEESDRDRRRELGGKIDDAADGALDILEDMPETSEGQRLLADLYGVKIRSKYQAKKYRKRMEQAAAKAIEIDATNSAAYVSSAKPYLFADERHRGDILQAMDLLEKAIKIDPDLEQAHLLLAHAYEKLEDNTEAVHRYEEILENNPRCRPALDALVRLGVVSSAGSP